MRCFCLVILSIIVAVNTAFATGSFTNYINTDNAPLLGDAGSHIWAATASAVFRIDKTTGAYEVFGTDRGFIGKPVCILVQSNNNVWIGTEKDGAYHYDGVRWTQFLFDLDGEPLAYVGAVVRSDDGAVWLGCHRFMGPKAPGALVRYTADSTTLIASAEGLPEGLIRQMIPWGNGLMVALKSLDWTNTVAVWNGSQMTTYTAADGLPATATSGFVYPELIRDNSGAIWLSDGNSGISRYANGQWKYMPVGASGGPQYPAVHIDIDANGHLWTIGPGGICRYDGQSWTAEVDVKTFPILDSSFPFGLEVDDAGRVWAALENDVLYLDNNTWKAVGKQTLRSSTRSLLPVDNGIAIATMRGIVLYRDNAWENLDRTDEPASSRITKIEVDSDNRVWTLYPAYDSVRAVGSYGDMWQHYGQQQGMTGTAYHSLLADDNGRVWAGTRGGLNTFFNQQWSFISAPADSLKTAEFVWVDHDVDGTIWTIAQVLKQIGPMVFTTYNTLLRYDGQQWNTSLLTTTEDTITNVSALARGNTELWLLSSPKAYDAATKTYTGGLYHRSGTTWSRHDLVRQYDMADYMNYVNGMAVDKSGMVWTSFQSEMKEVYTTIDTTIGPGGDTVITKTSSFAILDGGVSRYNGSAWEHRFFDTDIPVSGVQNGGVGGSCIAVAPDGNLWVGSAGAGVFRYDGQTWAQYMPVDGLVGTVVNDIDFDSKGGVWIATNDGVSSLADGFTVAVPEDNSTTGIRVRVSPSVATAAEGFRITVSTAAATDISVRLLDLAGRSVATLYRGSATQSTELHLHCTLPTLANGMYLVAVDAGGRTVIEKVVVGQ